VEIGDAGFAAAAADELDDRALTEATGGQCEAARWSFWLARRHVARNEAWFEAHEAGQKAGMAGCWLRQAEAAVGDMEKAGLVALARENDHRSEAVIAAAAPLGARLDAAGDEAAAREDWRAAFDHYLAALSVDPTLSWTRRALEDVRDRRLGIRAYKPEKKTTTKAPSGLRQLAEESKAKEEGAKEEAPRQAAPDEQPAALEPAGGPVAIEAVPMPVPEE
jgi:hypothetical protein